MVTMLNEERPPIWEQVNDWMDRHGPISNGQVCAISDLDTLRASKLLRRWVEQGLLVPDPTKAKPKRNMVYLKPVAATGNEPGLFAGTVDNNPDDILN